MIRVALECDIDVTRLDLEYSDTWKDQNVFWTAFRKSRAFKGHRLPPKSERRAWLLGLQQDLEANGEAVILTVTMHPIQSKTGPAMRLELHPLKREQSSRLLRKFGSNRFIEVRIPAVESWQTGEEDIVAVVAYWLTRIPHHFMERKWAGFYVLERSLKVEISEEQHHSQDGSDTKSVFYDRVLLFAEEGKGISKPCIAQTFRSQKIVGDSLQGACSRNEMLNWLLNLQANGSQSYLKLFHRISLGEYLPTAKTAPTLVTNSCKE